MYGGTSVFELNDIRYEPTDWLLVKMNRADVLRLIISVIDREVGDGCPLDPDERVRRVANSKDNISHDIERFPLAVLPDDQPKWACTRCFSYVLINGIDAYIN